MKFYPPAARIWGCVAAGLLASACDTGPLAPTATPAPGSFTAEYLCSVEVQTGSAVCHPAYPDGPLLEIIVGTPYVGFTISGSAISRDDPSNPDTLTMTTTIVNNTPQPMGTVDGTTPHVNGSRLFFTSGPTVTSVDSGTIAGSFIEADNALGPATFTSAQGVTYTNRLYYQYDGILAPGTAASQAVRFVFSSNVKTISYKYLFSAPVQYEHGWITLSPSITPVLALDSTATLTGTVYNQVGQTQADGITWSSSNTAIATVSSSGVVTAVEQGTVTITATSAVNPHRVGTRSVTVDAAPVVAGTVPARNAVDVDPNTSIQLTFSEAVDVSASSFAVVCAGLPQDITRSISSGGMVVTLIPANGWPTPSTCTVTVYAAHVTDADANDGPDQMAANDSISFDVSGFGGF